MCIITTSVCLIKQCTMQKYSMVVFVPSNITLSEVNKHNQDLIQLVFRNLRRSNLQKLHFSIFKQGSTGICIALGLFLGVHVHNYHYIVAYVRPTYEAPLSQTTQPFYYTIRITCFCLWSYPTVALSQSLAGHIYFSMIIKFNVGTFISVELSNV